MKVLFLHLSDLHIKQKEHIEQQKIDKLIDALNVVRGFDECVIICSGDLASSGAYNEYKQVRRFFGSLISKIVEKLSYSKFLNFLLVPGNHDANFANITRGRETIQEYYDKNKIQEHINEEIDMFKNFFAYSVLKSCFKYEKISDKRFITFGDYVIQVNLINTALFSTLLPDDKELHYFPNEELSSLKKHDRANIAITVMHHSTEWFQWECKQNLERAIYNNSSILFLGHDHNLCTKDLNINNTNSIFISAGGEFSSKDVVGKSEFNAVLLDTENHCIDSYEFKWNQEGNIYTHNKLFKNKSITTKNDKLLPNRNYLELMRQDEKRKVSNDFTQYFVFPTLTGKYNNNFSEKFEISNLNDFIKEIKEKKYIRITGGENSGKTTLMKILFLNLVTELTPLFFNAEGLRGKNIEKMIKITFEEQYGEDSLSYEQFQQLNKKQKVAIFDDFDLIKSDRVRSEIMSNIKQQFEYIVIGTKANEELDIAKHVENEINELNEKDFFYTFKINEFFLTKRQDLIKNVCKALKPMNDEDIEKITDTINGFVKHQFQLFELDPDFIIQFTQYFLQSYDIQNLKNEAIFNKIFETNIYNALIQNMKTDSVDEIITSLEEIAYYIHFNKKDPLPLNELEIVINKYNYDYSVGVKVRELVDIACRAKILKFTDNDGFTLRFCNKNHLAFFVARCLNRKFYIDGSFSDIEYVLKNICFGINDNIILFISYLTSNPRIIMSIYQEAENLMRDWVELDLDKENINFLSKIRNSQEVKAPRKGDKAKMDEIQNKYEENERNDQLIECNNLYDYDESNIDKFNYKIKRAIKYTEMLSKSLPNFNNILLKENKHKITNGIYKNPNKILFELFKPLDENFEHIVGKIKEFADSIDARSSSGQAITKYDIESMIHMQAIYLMLNIYNNFAFLATDKKSIKILDAYNLTNTSYKIFNLMVAENHGASEEFSKKAIEIYDNTIDKNVKKMIVIIAKKHLIYTPRIKYFIRQQLVDKFFPKQDVSDFLIESNKRKLTSK